MNTPNEPMLSDADLSAYLDHELPAEQRAAVERALAQSPELREQLRQLQQVVEAVRSLPRHKLDATRATHIAADLASRALRKPRAHLWLTIGRWSGVAAALVLCTTAGWFAGTQHARRNQVASTEESSLRRPVIAELPQATPNPQSIDEPPALARRAPDQAPRLERFAPGQGAESFRNAGDARIATPEAHDTVAQAPGERFAAVTSVQHAVPAAQADDAPVLEISISSADLHHFEAAIAQTQSIGRVVAARLEGPASAADGARADKRATASIDLLVDSDELDHAWSQLGILLVNNQDLTASQSGGEAAAPVDSAPPALAMRAEINASPQPSDTPPMPGRTLRAAQRSRQQAPAGYAPRTTQKDTDSFSPALDGDPALREEQELKQLLAELLVPTDSARMDHVQQREERPASPQKPAPAAQAAASTSSQPGRAADTQQVQPAAQPLRIRVRITTPDQERT